MFSYWKIEGNESKRKQQEKNKIKIYLKLINYLYI